ncbi:HNH endonuclease [Microbacterium sp. cx-55]|uniref:HNH endonuclease n=1 Tax=Microbacterium sp. cx-55 TaxID=2875948 RepID=UPI001CBFED94|nr:HNH endonuclease [Microbacterium sp. cx-55]MBZ4485972.1 HNH endonuclease [Microbacterium sp. cx-55]UGB34154.1 HNH endonuclease [Microbacterium sp. cx-55]
MSNQSSRGAKWQALRRSVLERDGWICSACGNHLEDNHPNPAHDATADHIVSKDDARRRGWTEAETDTPSNLTAMCRKCNGTKQDAPLLRVDWFNPRWFAEGFAA